MALYAIFRLPSCTIAAWLPYAAKPFGVVARNAASSAATRMPPRLVLNEADIEEAFLKGSGPGGQKIVGIPSYESSAMPQAQLTCMLSLEQNFLRRPTQAHSFWGSR